MKKVALLVGVEQYQDKAISPLRFATADVRAVADRLRQQCGFDHVRVLSGQEGPDAPTLGNVIDALGDMAGELRPDDLFLFFFSGHGVEVGEHAYLLTYESRQAFPEQMSLSVALLRRYLERVQAGRRVLLVDACRNDPHAGKGDAGHCMSDVMAKDIAAVARAVSASGERVTALLSACRPGQRAYEWNSKGHGVFSYYLLEGLDGAAWDGGVLTFRGLAMRTAQEVRRWSASTPGIAHAQEPWYEESGLPGEIELGRGTDRSGKAAPDAGDEKRDDVETWQAAAKRRRAAEARKRRREQEAARRAEAERQRAEEAERLAEVQRQDAARRLREEQEAERQRQAEREAERQRKAAQEAERRRQAEREAERQRKAAQEAERRRQAERERARVRAGATPVVEVVNPQALREQLVRDPGDVALRKRYLAARTPPLKEKDEAETFDYMSRRTATARAWGMVVVAAVTGLVFGGVGTKLQANRGGAGFAIALGIVGAIFGVHAARRKEKIDHWIGSAVFFMVIGEVLGRLWGRTDGGSLATDWNFLIRKQGQDGGPWLAMWAFFGWLSSIPAVIVEWLAGAALGIGNWEEPPSAAIKGRAELGPLPVAAYRLKLQQLRQVYLGEAPPAPPPAPAGKG
jgi:flagellar biosynthesis GTPase FlhF